MSNRCFKVVVREGRKIIKVVKCSNYEEATDLCDSLENRYGNRYTIGVE